jgi:antirestriction protein ArdC
MAFFDSINWYRTILHELCHATGHESRLGRNLKNAFGSKDYAREELVAELGSAFLCAALGIVPTVRHADYLGAWLEVLQEDNRAIFRAASAASKAADWLLVRHAELKTGKRAETPPKARDPRRLARWAGEGGSMILFPETIRRRCLSVRSVTGAHDAMACL